MDIHKRSQSYTSQFLQHRATDVNSLHDAVIDMNDSGSKSKVLAYITCFIMTKMMLKAVIKKHGQVAINTLYKEFLE